MKTSYYMWEFLPKRRFLTRSGLSKCYRSIGHKLYSNEFNIRETVEIWVRVIAY